MLRLRSAVGIITASIHGAYDDLGHPNWWPFLSKATKRARRYIDEHFPQLRNRARSGRRSATGRKRFRGQSAGSAAEKRNDHYQSGAGMRSRRMARTRRSLPLRRATMLARPIRWTALHVIIHHKSWKRKAAQSVAFFLSAILDNQMSRARHWTAAKRIDLCGLVKVNQK